MCSDVLSSRTLQIKEGLNRLLCLAPYGIVNFKVCCYFLFSMLEITLIIAGMYIPL